MVRVLEDELLCHATEELRGRLGRAGTAGKGQGQPQAQNKACDQEKSETGALPDEIAPVSQSTHGGSPLLVLDRLQRLRVGRALLGGGQEDGLTRLLGEVESGEHVRGTHIPGGH